jgi:AcrR family transcriptional regulator
MPPVTDRMELRSTQQKLIETGERLFALHGLQGVSLRQIGTESGSGNSSAVQYHFGSKEELVREILLYRLPRINERRAMLFAMASPTDLRQVLEAHLLPILEQSELDDSYYLTFVEHVLCFSTEPDPLDTLPNEYVAPRNAFVSRVRSLITEIPEPIATRRILDVTAMCLHTSAARERARRDGSPIMSLRSQCALLMDCVLGYVTATVSDASLQALIDEPPTIIVPERVDG